MARITAALVGAAAAVACSAAAPLAAAAAPPLPDPDRPIPIEIVLTDVEIFGAELDQLERDLRAGVFGEATADDFARVDELRSRLAGFEAEPTAVEFAAYDGFFRDLEAFYVELDDRAPASSPAVAVAEPAAGAEPAVAGAEPAVAETDVAPPPGSAELATVPQVTAETSREDADPVPTVPAADDDGTLTAQLLAGALLVATIAGAAIVISRRRQGGTSTHGVGVMARADEPIDAR
ncbi:MAG: hypothetical protein QNJ12_23525 [Ilumatobacter sp.]|uniref:hypothetical protein n=1 Tax=Ilumatobacter sp. TaxID=1967498 RepID=UPI00260E4F6E|nr:hypothetical protein [Ilumatobacter sp.]MDJ0771776.1 hypothetical protein [Ilumatobacter sp.]